MTHLYDVTLIDPIPGLGFVRPNAMNSKGQVVGTLTENKFYPFGRTHAFLWSRSVGMKILSPLSIGGNPLNCSAVSINDFGTVVVEVNSWTWLWTPTVQNGTTGTWRWTFAAGVAGINNSGHMTGFMNGVPSLFSAPDTAHSLNAGGDPTAARIPFAINDMDQVVGESGLWPVSLPFLWQPSTGGSSTGHVHALPLAAGAVGGLAWGVSSRGVVVGYMNFADGSTKPFRWHPSSSNATSGVTEELAVLSGFSDGIALAVNNDHTVVGQCSGFPLGTWACILEENESRALNGLIAIPIATLFLIEAIAINNEGSILCRSGGPRVPPPASRDPGGCVLTPVPWLVAEVHFLDRMARLIGGEDDGPTLRFPPIGPPRPIPAWLRELMTRLPPEQRVELVEMALRERTELLRDSQAHQRLHQLVPGLRQSKTKR